MWRHRSAKCEKQTMCYIICPEIPEVQPSQVICCRGTAFKLHTVHVTEVFTKKECHVSCFLLKVHSCVHAKKILHDITKKG